MMALKSILLSKLVLRLMYITAAYSTSYIVALVSSPKVAGLMDGAGISFSVADPAKLKTTITAGMLFGGEFVWHFFHERFILPHVNVAPLGVTQK